jgi:hypothetical protein
MPFSRTFDPQRKWLLTRATGPVSYEELVNHMLEVQQEGLLGYPQFIDGTSASIAFSEIDARRIVRSVQDLSVTQPFGPSAVLVSNDVVFGMSRMLEMLLGDTMQVRTFRDRTEAEAWLGSASQKVYGE